MALALRSLCAVRVLARAASTAAASTTGANTVSASASAAAPSAAAPGASVWTPRERRTGAIAVKLGMMPFFDAWGTRHPCTALHIRDNVVVRVLTADRDGYDGLVIGAALAKAKHVRKPELGLYAKASVQPRRKLWAFHVSRAAALAVGTALSAAHFMPGQYVDVVGTTRGKGFAGPMKRWGFAGLPASHGVSISHRSHGSTSSHQDPGRVWKGKKMAGRMGSATCTQKCLRVMRVDLDQNVILVRGSVPGPAKGWLRVTDAIYRKFPLPPPFPTYVRTADSPVFMDADKSATDPFAQFGV